MRSNMPIGGEKLRESLERDFANPKFLREPQWVVCRARTKLVDDSQSTVLKESTIRNKLTILSDEPSQRGGVDKAPAPIEVMMASLGQCLATVHAYLASLRGLRLKAVEVDARCYIDQRGVYDLIAAENRGFDRIVYDVRIDSDEPEEKIKELVLAAERSCPAHGTLRRACPMIGSVYQNGNFVFKTEYKPGS